MYFNRVNADDARNNVIEEAKAFIKQQNTEQKKLKKKVLTTKSSNRVGIYEEAKKYILDHRMKTRKYTQKS